MQETLKMMKSILTGKECKVAENELITKYQEKLSPNILAYFYCNNYGLIYNVSQKYSIITDEDKASFCLHELDKCLMNFDITQDLKFITYFMKCYKNRLRMETEQLLTQKRKIILNYELLDNVNISNDLDINDVDLFLDNYNLDDAEKKQCKLLNIGYTIKEIAKILNLADTTIYKRNAIIKQKILNSNTNFA